jgi:hypothetical protein
MVILVVAAMFGAALGLFMRNGLLAVVLAPLTLGAAQFGAIAFAQQMIHRPDQADLAATIQTYAGAEPMAILPTVVAALGSALIAVVMMAMARKQREDRDPLGAAIRPGSRDRRHGLKLATALNERPIHADSERRFDKLLDR